MQTNEISNKLVTKDAERRLKEETLPIVLWGAGSMGLQLYHKLKDDGINVDAFLLTAGFHRQDSDQIFGLSIYSLDELCDQYASCVIIIGHGHYEKWMEIENVENIKRIYMIAHPYPQYTGPDNEFIKNNKSLIDATVQLLNDEESKEAMQTYLMIHSEEDVSYLLYQRLISNYYDFYQGMLPNRLSFMDIGAWTGDSIDLFIKWNGEEYEEIIAVEPDPISMEQMKLRLNGQKAISYYQMGLGKEDSVYYMDGKGSQSNSLSRSTEGMAVDVKRIDSVFADRKVDLLKISVPFLFFEILQGAENYIKDYSPKLIINVGADDKHRVFSVINWLKEVQPDYSISLRFDFAMTTRLWLYAY